MLVCCLLRGLRSLVVGLRTCFAPPQWVDSTTKSRVSSISPPGVFPSCVLYEFSFLSRILWMSAHDSLRTTVPDAKKRQDSGDQSTTTSWSCCFSFHFFLSPYVLGPHRRVCIEPLTTGAQLLGDGEFSLMTPSAWSPAFS